VDIIWTGQAQDNLTVTGKVLNISCNESRSIITAVTRKIFDISCNEPEVSEQLLQISTIQKERRNAKNREMNHKYQNNCCKLQQITKRGETPRIVKTTEQITKESGTQLLIITPTDRSLKCVTHGPCNRVTAYELVVTKTENEDYKKITCTRLSYGLQE